MKRIKFFNKKTILSIAIIVFAIYIAFAFCHFIVGYFKYNIGAHELKSFWSLHGDLTYIVDDFQEIYKNARENNPELYRIYIYYMATSGEIKLNYAFSENTKNYDEIVALSEKQQSALFNIWGAFQGHDYGSLGHISVSDNQIAFYREGDYALVYSKNGLAPSYIIHEQVNDIYVKRISLKWFHCLNVASP